MAQAATITQAQVQEMADNVAKFQSLSVAKIADHFGASQTSVRKVRKIFEAKGLYQERQTLTLADMVEQVLAQADNPLKALKGKAKKAA